MITLFITCILTFFFMEIVAWLTHKYIMHGFLWNLHADHHKKDHHHSSFFEKNDYFFVIFAVPGILSLLIGSITSNYFLYGFGVGISLYGTCYFLVHDVFIHQRFKWLRNSNNFYFRAIRRAHKVHHKHLGKEDGECFGMLFVPYIFFKQEIDKNS